MAYSFEVKYLSQLVSFIEMNARSHLITPNAFNSSLHDMHKRGACSLNKSMQQILLKMLEALGLSRFMNGFV